ncbi:hypothetical protein FHU36_005420 [Nonomuraea muscovyensis]|uniref:Uncharacterized protein n=1 Tax=Nonomuraea muscovyensis TaxID=1124761 RepID=A0A7X0F1G4_9ACTN|nr:hypothetical protein [Nonomuraea muscovyensis]
MADALALAADDVVRVAPLEGAPPSWTTPRG